MGKRLIAAALLACMVAIPGLAQDEGVTGSVDANAVRLRQEPTLQGKQIGSLATGEEVTVPGRTDETMKVDIMEAYWYRVRTTAGVEGCRTSSPST